MAHFYLDDSLAAQLAGADAPLGAIVRLTGPDARHAVTVSRVRPGEHLRLGDGAGLIVEGEVVESSAQEVVLRVEHVERAPEPSPRIVLVQALAKGDRDELAIQAATELGVDAIVPWQAARSVSRWDAAKAEKGRARWATIVREASKQAIRPRVPEVAPLATTAAIARLAASATVLVLDPLAEHPLTALDAGALGDRDVVLVVGPEGGVAPEELAALVAAGARGMRLGRTVLRTSTAGPAAIAVLSAALGRW
ncbi:16S rRNA (uracil(1498)-N(3))-methyltransferase [Yonghaparkia sp. Root332]|uniref:16S rRNA (uracil(1498)-N(3))-methyltransferase n=1 Tax=Yonghaparkia sp. Root332 TaxID=1736516 RepID=UPI0006FF61B2|nr:16S rRNA (uracil(1498)-N(3))-methyltransferase [Yonghaparkia sp. Root332]KQV24873.1 16S rRNA methyltransferase [Yonghaparkia sp. Root332]